MLSLCAPAFAIEYAVDARVKEYLVAPSQYTNNGQYGKFIDTTLTQNGNTTSLGNYGGYVVYEFNTPVMNDPKNPYGVDFRISGNAFNGALTTQEPGQVWVSQDGENWYYFDASGRPCVGWKKINNRWFYFDGEGVMLTGVHYIDGYWYELSMFGGYNRSYSPPASHEYTEEEYAALYQPVLDRYRAFYRDFQEAYSSGNMYTYDVSECCRSSTSVGYTLLDLDGNGIQELLIGTTDYYMETNPILFDVYTISNGILSRVFISWGRNRHYLLDDMRIYNEGSSGAAYNSYVLYSLSGNNLSPIDGVQTTENPSAGPICRYRTTEFKMIQPEELRISDEEAQALIDGWKSHIIVPQLTTFAYVGMS